MKPPCTYFEWKEMLDKFSKGDDQQIHLMNEGTAVLDAGTAERFMLLFEDAYKKRKQLWMDKFKNISQTYNIRSSADFSVVISQVKSSLKNLVFYTELKPFRDDLKKILKDDLRSFMEETKKSLKENAMRERTNQVNSLLIVFDNLDIGKVTAPTILSQQENLIPNKKRIIF